MKLDENFMKNFRWITPLLLFLLNLIVGLFGYIALNTLSEFKKLKEDFVEMKVDVASIKTFLTRELK